MKINGDKIIQRYLPARGNKNSIVRIIWTKGIDEKSHMNQAQGGTFKMYQVSANRQYDGKVSQEKYTPKKPLEPSMFLNQLATPKASNKVIFDDEPEIP